MARDTPAGIMDPLVPPDGKGLYKQMKRRVGLDDPDLRRNALYWVRTTVYGWGLVGRTLRLASRAREVADLGCGSGWLALELARRNAEARIRAIDHDARLLEWARAYYLSRRDRGPLGEVRHECADLESLEFPPQSLDAAVSFFCLGCLHDPVDLLRRVHGALRPGGLLVYYEATAPPELNVGRLGWLWERRCRWRGEARDPWGARREVLAAYLEDAVRRHRPAGAPAEQETFDWLRGRFDVMEEVRTRAFVDIFAGRLLLRESLWRLPLLKLADEVVLAAGLLQGACRFALARKPWQG